MENSSKILEALEEAHLHLLEGNGSTVMLSGESGIGKTHVIKRFIDRHKKNAFIVETRGLPAAQPALSSIYETLFLLISNGQVTKEIYVSLLKKYSKLLPGFGQYVVPLVGHVWNDAFQQVITRSGIAFGTSPVIHIIKFVIELAKGQPIHWVFDDAQWLDSETWTSLVYIVNNAKKLGLSVIVIYNDRVEQWHNTEFDTSFGIDYWRKHATEIGWTSFEAKRWTVDHLNTLCSELLGGCCMLPKNAVCQLHSYTSGIPLYVKSVLDVLVRQHKIAINNGIWQPTCSWEKLDICEHLRDSIEQRLKAAYNSIPNSRPSLEIASVVGETFHDDIIDNLLDADSSFECLCKIERCFRIVQYLFDKRYWAFEHNLIRDSIYHSLGTEARRIHLHVANYLNNQTTTKGVDVEPLTIAFHYEQAGELESAARHKLREVERLLGNALFGAALSLLDHIRSQMASELSGFPSELRDQIDMLQGRLLYHTAQYAESMKVFRTAMQDTNKTILKEAICHRWLGRCLLKLKSQVDFRDSVAHLKHAQNIYQTLGDLKAQGDVYTDMVVAYAHLNQFGKAKAAFAEAEDKFNQVNDDLGMARLQRRSVIFMEEELAAPIMERLAQRFDELGVPHEVIMALNNAATEYLYLGQYGHVEELITQAMEISVEIGGFEERYLYNNLALAKIMQCSFDEAHKCIKQARQGCLREVEQLILDINDGVLIAESIGMDAAESTLKRALQVAVNTGEYAYLIPAKINLATCLYRMNQTTESINLLESISPNRDNAYSAYKNTHWFKLLLACYKQVGKSEQANNLVEKYSWCNLVDTNSYYEYAFMLVDMQFWSD